MAKFNLKNEKFGMDEKKDDKKNIGAGSSNDVVSTTTTSTAAITQPVMKKAPMMNIRFTPENYDYMRRESSLRGLSVTAFTNWIINAYKADSKNVHENPMYLNEENW